LVWLNLSGNVLENLPEEFASLSALLWLDLSNNQFSVLPDPIIHLKTITELNLQGSFFPAPPSSSAGHCGKHFVAFFVGNQLLSLPEEIGQLVAMEKLTISKNKLTSIPDEIGSLMALKELDLSSNELVVLPQSLAKLSKLTVLGLGKNRISVLPHGLGVLRRIRILDVRDNPLELPPLEIVSQGSQAILKYLRESMKTSSASANHTIAVGDGLEGGVVGKELTFTVVARDDKGGL